MIQDTKFVKYGTADVEDAGRKTTDDVGFRSLKLHFDFGGLNRFAGVGGATVTIDTLTHKGTFSIAAAASTILAVDDYLMYGPGGDSLLGRIQSVNYSTGAIGVIDIPITLKTGTYSNMVAEYYEIARGYFIGIQQTEAT
jgi:hypothetical protein